MYRLFLVPTLVINLAIILIPAIPTIPTVILAFYRWNGMSPPGSKVPLIGS